MATDIKIIGPNIVDIPPSDDTNCRPVIFDAYLIVNEILKDIFDKAIRKSEEAQQVKQDEKRFTDTGDLIIDLTRNYKEEFKNILQSLKCQTHKTQPTDNANLEDQIKKVIEEIKSLEISLRRNIDEGRGDINMTEEIKNPVSCQKEITNFLNPENPDENRILLDDDSSEEIVLQVINLQEDSEVSSFNAFPSEDDLEEVNLINEEHQRQELVADSNLINFDLSAGENEVQKPVPDPEPEEKLVKSEEGRKKKSLGRRLWHFMRKSSKNGSAQSVEKQSFASKALNYEFM